MNPVAYMSRIQRSGSRPRWIVSRTEPRQADTERKTGSDQIPCREHARAPEKHDSTAFSAHHLL